MALKTIKCCTELLVHQSDGRPHPDAWPSYRTHALTHAMQRRHIRYIILHPRMLYIETRKIKLEFYVQTRKCGAGGRRCEGQPVRSSPRLAAWSINVDLSNIFPRRGAWRASCPACGGVWRTAEPHTRRWKRVVSVCGGAGVRKRWREVRNAGHDKIWTLLLLFCTEASEFRTRSLVCMCSVHWYSDLEYSCYLSWGKMSLYTLRFRFCCLR